jgi:hypothetical protein
VLTPRQLVLETVLVSEMPRKRRKRRTRTTTTTT